MEVGDCHKHGGWVEGHKDRGWLLGRVTSMEVDGEGHKHGD